MAEEQKPSQNRGGSGKKPNRKPNPGKSKPGSGKTAQKSNRPPQNKQKRNNQNKKRQGPRPKTENQDQTTPRAKNVVTKKPVWGNADSAPSPAAEKQNAPKNNSRQRRGKGRSQKQQHKEPEKNIPEIRRDENGIFDFSEEELAEDKGLQVISRRNNTETKYANFEEFLKDH